MKTEIEQRTAVGSLIKAAANALAAVGIETALLDAELLMAKAAGVTRAQVLSGYIEAGPAVIARYGEFVARRSAREPLAYIVGHKEFFSLDFEVTPAVLIPRPETETLVATALEVIAGRREALVLDLGTGSGAVAIAIAANTPSAVKVIATDVSKAVLEVARRNAARLGCAGRIEFVEGDCWEALAASESDRQFDLVASNPPYVETASLESLEPEIRDFEPRIALTDGADGLEFYRRIASGIRGILKPRGELLVEIGAGQAEPVLRLFREAGCLEAVAIRDLSGTERVIRARF